MRRIITLTFLAFLVLGVTTAVADGIIYLQPPRWPHTTPPPPPPTPLEIRVHRVVVEISDGAAVTKVDQTFYNPNNAQLEGTYLFPIPEQAAINGFSMYVDGKETKGELLDRDQARKIYEDIVRSMRDPGLLEYVDSRTYKARVFPIPANGETRVKLEYSEPVKVESGLATYRYPLNTEKFSSKPLKEVVVDVVISTQMPLKSVVCPSHKVDVAKKSDHEARVGYEATNTLPDKDFVLYLSFSKADFGMNLATYREPGEDGYFLAMISPGMEVESDKILEKDLLLVLDTSGSMGERGKIVQARDALKFCLRNLARGDRFNVIDFSTTTNMFRDALAPATENNVNAAIAYVDKLEARGGTAIYEALTTAVKLAKDDDRPCMIIFITDGMPTVGPQDAQEILDGVKKAAAGKPRIFTFGVGHDVNTHLLDRLADENHGAQGYVPPGEDIEQNVSNLYSKVSSPVLSDLSLEFGGGLKVTDVYPRTLNDLFRGSQLTVVGRYSGDGAHAITLRGAVGKQVKEFVYEAKFAESDRGHEFIPRVWATRKIAYLVDEARLHGDNKELKDEIVRLSRKYGILTPYTSFLVAEDVKVREGRGEPVPLGPAPRELESARPAMDKAASEAAAPTGSGSVQFSIGQNAMRTGTAAEPAQFMGRESRDVVAQVGAETYYKRDGVWVSSEFTPGTETVKVAYLSDEYFELARKRVELARAFALGSRVIAKAEGKFYEVVE